MPTNELRVMDWLGFQLKYLLTNFQLDHLVQLNMPCSIKQLWKGIKLGSGLPEWYNIRSTDSCITLKLHEDFDDNGKWYGYSYCIVYEAHEHEKWNSRGFDGPRPDYEEFVKTVYQFETDEGLLKSSLVFRAPKDHSLGPLRFGMYIPTNWFLERLNNLEEWSYIKALVETSCPDIEVKECGVRLYCRNTARELYSHGSQQYALDVVHYLAKCYWRTVSPAAKCLSFF
ncbi:hypothetical protein CJ030_MR1G029268 [Morella rubra]|uniref:C-JID domain-containing protein n=1 Tax=Morella rubra TaxID=262757 RepID=A0A6A1WKC6_9ROSI|nr:hypothetical protein CJ030_MR1G029268 [Morella rubra]